METLRGWADGGILVAYLSSVDVPFGTSLVKLFVCTLGKDVFILLQPLSEGFILRLQTEVVKTVHRWWILFHPVSFWGTCVLSSVCKGLLICVAHSKSQELNDELSVWSQIYARVPLVCIKSQRGGKMAAPPKQKFFTNPHPLIPPPTIHGRSPQSHNPDNWASWLPLLCRTARLSLPHYHWISICYGLKQIVIILVSVRPVCCLNTRSNASFRDLY